MGRAARTCRGTAASCQSFLQSGLNTLTAGVIAPLAWGATLHLAAAQAVLIALGIAMLAGWEPVVSLPHLEKGGRDRTFRSMYLFGVSYAIASLGCTLPARWCEAVSSTSLRWRSSRTASPRLALIQTRCELMRRPTRSARSPAERASRCRSSAPQRAPASKRCSSNSPLKLNVKE